jgi:hypothetical protein
MDYLVKSLFLFLVSAPFLALKCGQAGDFGFKFVKLKIRGAAKQVPLSKLAQSS